MTSMLHLARVTIGFRKVGEGYKKGKKVGYAQISKGIDFYICPCSEVIISKARSSHASLPSQSNDNDFVDDDTNN
ncbi:hypothetical protein NMG60_11012277 [Bertholletia excelsa]